MRISAPLAMLLALAACNEAPQKPDTKPSAQKETGDAAKVAALNEDQRNIVLAKAIRASGANGCLSVEKSERIAMMNGAPGWKGECDDGSAHLVEILSDGTAKVTSRTH